jgi:hypothetical protein
MSPIRIIFIWITIVFVNTVSVVKAESNRATILPDSTTPFYNTNGGEIESIDVSYQDEDQEYRFLVKFKKDNLNKIPQGFWLVTNGTGQDPKGSEGELPIFYFDFRDTNNPILSAYVYNGTNDNSHIDSYPSLIGDQFSMIFSSLVDTATVKGFAIEEGNDYLNVGFIIDGKVINNIKPEIQFSKSSWQGLKFTDKIGVWLHTFPNLNAKYGNLGQLLNFTSNDTGFIDITNIATYKNDPVCNNTNKKIVTFPDNFTLTSVVACDAQKDQLSDISIEGFKNLTFITQQINSSSNDRCVKADIEFAPTLADVGKHKVEVLFSDIFGGKAKCSVDLEVFATQDDIIEIPDFSTPDSIPTISLPNDSTSNENINTCKEFKVKDTLVELDKGSLKLLSFAELLGNKIRKLHGKLSEQDRKSLSRSQNSHIKSWEVLNSIPTNIVICKDSDIANIDLSLKDIIKKYKINSKVGLKSVRLLTKSIIKSSKSKIKDIRKARKIFKIAKNQDIKNNKNSDKLILSIN